mgnify:CR=1 FL=1
MWRLTNWVTINEYWQALFITSLNSSLLQKYKTVSTKHIFIANLRHIFAADYIKKCRRFQTMVFTEGPWATRMVTPTTTTTAKNNSKYNNCTSECIELSTCTELSPKLGREKTFLWLSRLRERNRKKLSQYLLSFNHFLFTNLRQKNKTLMTHTKK